MDSNTVLFDAKSDFQKSIDYLKSEFSKVQAGKNHRQIKLSMGYDFY